jgi:hypothetical protein
MSESLITQSMSNSTAIASDELEPPNGACIQGVFLYDRRLQGRMGRRLAHLVYADLA